jgi:peptide/nickel transport system ATP-binding protein
MNRQQDILTIDNLRVQYSSNRQIIHAVNGISLRLAAGKSLALVGETGAGKTTIAKSILRILPKPQGKTTAGRIVLDGQDVLTLSEAEMRKLRGRKASMVFQDPMTSLNPVLRVGDQIAEVVRKHRSLGAAPAHAQAVEMLELVGIDGRRADEYPHQFSGGMKQRVVIAMALACNPGLLIADEPTSALDVTIQAQILEMMIGLRDEHNTALLLITHDMGVVGEMCDSVAIVYAGEILEYGEKRELFRHPLHPYTKGLFAAIPDIRVKTRRLANIAGLPPDPAALPAGCCFSPRCAYVTEECKSQKPLSREVTPGHYCGCLLVRGQEGGRL